MLRLVSIIGIALAMVIGFVAISTQMRDEFYIRTKVSGVATYMKQLAEQELQCNRATLVPALPTEMQQPANESSRKEMQPKLASTVADSETNNDDPQASDKALNKPAIVSAVEQTIMDDGSMELVAIFTDVQGESGKLRIKAGRQLTLNCGCRGPQTQHVNCQTVASDLNKNYVPGKISQ